MVEEAEILEDDADPPPQIGAAVLAQGCRVMIEHADQAAGRPQRQQHQPQQRGLAGAGRAGEELEGMPADPEIEVAQHLGAEPIAQADILEPDHAVLRSLRIDKRRPRLIRGLPENLIPRPGCAGRHGFQFVNGSAGRVSWELRRRR